MGSVEKELLLTYTELGRSITKYTAPVWSVNASPTKFGKIHVAENEVRRTATCSHLMENIDHIQVEKARSRKNFRAPICIVLDWVSGPSEEHTLH